MLYFLIAILVLLFIYLFYLYFNINKDNELVIKNDKSTMKSYKIKRIMSSYEHMFYSVLVNNFSNDYIIVPQLNLASIVEKYKQFNKQYQNELYRNIDFGLIDKTTLFPVLLIEINDKSHNEYSRKQRDIKVKNICSNANIKLITFYTNMPNKESYIVDRVQKEIINTKKSS